MKEMQITLPENVMDAIRVEAGQLGITPNVLARIQLCQLHFPVSPDTHARSYLVKLENWREVELYVEARGLKSIGHFLQKTAEAFMKKYHITAAQKAEAEELLKKRKEASAYQSACL